MYKVRRSKVHGNGVFAAQDIPKGTKVIEYVGRKVTKKQAEDIAEAQYKRGESKKTSEGHVYLFELNSRYDIDGNVSWNPARFINHSCDPNCETEVTRGHIWIVAIKDIKKGEELSYDYGYDLADALEHPCKCGAANCCGYIVSSRVRWRLKKKLAERQ